MNQQRARNLKSLSSNEDAPPKFMSKAEERDWERQAARRRMRMEAGRASSDNARPKRPKKTKQVKKKTVNQTVQPTTPTPMDTSLLTLELIERNIDDRTNIAECLNALRATSKRVNELTDRVLALYDFPDPEEETGDDVSFAWPGTAIMPGQKALSNDHFDYERGVLSFLGYRVGRSGVGKRKRHAVLVYTFNDRLPMVGSLEYMEEWGKPKSGKRLKKMADSLASFARNGQSNERQDMSEAVNQWIDDLAWLKSEYYDGKFDRKFRWPRPS